MRTLTEAVASNDAGRQYVLGLQSLLGYYQRRKLEAGNRSGPALRFADALARHWLLERTAPLLADKAQVAVFGGAGAGKSTTVNVLLGGDFTEANAQAGYTRHPVAFLAEDDGREALPTHLGSLRRHDHPTAAEHDAEVYSWRVARGVAGDLLADHVVWDCPDLTSRDSSYYETRVIEIAALADVTLYVASDERYNDELPTRFLRTMLAAGRPVVAVLTKAHPADAAELERMFREQVLAKCEGAEHVADVVVIPAPPGGRVETLWAGDHPAAVRLRTAVTGLTADLRGLRSQLVERAVLFLSRRQDEALAPLRLELDQWDQWREAVRGAAAEAKRTYRQLHLDAVRYEAVEKLRGDMVGTDRLTVPPQWFWKTADLVRLPYRFLRKAAGRLVPAVDPEALDESDAIDQSRQGMLEKLQIWLAGKRQQASLYADLHAALGEEVKLRIEPLFIECHAAARRAVRDALKESVAAVRRRVHSVRHLLVLVHLVRFGLDLSALFLAWWWFGLNLWMFLVAIAMIGVVEEISRLVGDVLIGRVRAAVVEKDRAETAALIERSHVEPLLELPRPVGRQLHELADASARLPSQLAHAGANSRKRYAPPPAREPLPASPPPSGIEPESAVADEAVAESAVADEAVADEAAVPDEAVAETADGPSDGQAVARPVPVEEAT